MCGRDSDERVSKEWYRLGPLRDDDEPAVLGAQSEMRDNIGGACRAVAFGAGLERQRPSVDCVDRGGRPRWRWGDREEEAA